LSRSGNKSEGQKPNQPQTFDISSFTALNDFVSKLKAWVEASPKKRILFFLQGEVGAGKTTFVVQFVNRFVRQAAEKISKQNSGQLGKSFEAQSNTDQPFEAASSPTFALHHRYQFDSVEINHWDLYRIESFEELESSGFLEAIEFSEDTSEPGGPSKVIDFIEWSERIRDFGIDFSKHKSQQIVHIIFNISVESLSADSSALNLLGIEASKRTQAAQLKVSEGRVVSITPPILL
jgi:tRNA A37 threonylcarbamoyladenosine biosynthesis protein TsaE